MIAAGMPLFVIMVVTGCACACQFSLQISLYSCVRVTFRSGTKLHTRFCKSCLGSSADAAANQYVDALICQKSCQSAVSGSVGANHFTFYDLIILYFIYLERLGLSEMLKYIAIVISYCDFHDKILPFLLYTQAVFLLCRSRLSAFHTLRFYIV